MAPSAPKVHPARDLPENLAVWCEADEAIALGDACYCTGYSGGVRHMVKADADTAKHLTGDLLFAGCKLPSGERGKFFPWMILKDIDTSAYAQGDTLYLSSTAGGFSATPTRAIGQVVEVSATVGAVVLSGWVSGNTANPAWTAISTLGTGWTSSAGGAGDWPALAYRLNADGTTEIRGALYADGTANGNNMCTLPAAALPNGDTSWIVTRITGASAYSHRLVTVRPTGHANAGRVLVDDGGAYANGDQWLITGRWPRSTT